MRRVLIVEDNKDLTLILKKRFEDKGFRVDTIETGYALLAYLKDAAEPDAIVLDLMLPERSGMELLDSMASVWKNTRIFIFSAHPECKDRHLLDRYNIGGFFCKSDGIDNLIKAMLQELGGGTGQADT